MNSGSSSSERSRLELELAESFLPAWVKEAEVPDRLSRLAKQYEDKGSGHRKDMTSNHHRRPGKTKKEYSERRPSRRPPEIRTVSLLEGWNVRFIPDQRGVDGLVKQLKGNAKAYPLFELALLVLEKPQRFHVEFTQHSGSHLFQFVADASVWLSEKEALAHALKEGIDTFYRRERITVAPPDGSYPFVAQCGMSGILLGPPNYHDYQNKISQLHAERFSDVPFDIYKSRIRMLKDAESVQKWKEDQSTKEIFYPIQASEGKEVEQLSTYSDVEGHFRQNHLKSAIVSTASKFIIPGQSAVNFSASPVRHFVQSALEELRRFPLAMAHILGQELAAKGLQIFKAHENITYVCVARPRYLNREVTPVAERLNFILDYLERHPAVPRKEQWEAIAASGSLPSDAAESAAMKDLSWLLREGHVIDYAHRNLEITRRPAVTLRASPSTLKSHAK